MRKRKFEFCLGCDHLVTYADDHSQLLCRKSFSSFHDGLSTDVSHPMGLDSLVAFDVSSVVSGGVRSSYERRPLPVGCENVMYRLMEL